MTLFFLIILLSIVGIAAIPTLLVIIMATLRILFTLGWLVLVYGLIVYIFFMNFNIGVFHGM